MNPSRTPIDELVKQYHAADDAVAQFGAWFAQVIDLGNRAKDNDDYTLANACSALALAAYFGMPRAMRAGCSIGPHPARIEIETRDSSGESLDEGYYDLVVVVTDWPLPSQYGWGELRLCIPAPMLTGLALIPAYKAAGDPKPRLDHGRSETDYDSDIGVGQVEEYEILAEQAGDDICAAAKHILAPVLADGGEDEGGVQ